MLLHVVHQRVGGDVGLELVLGIIARIHQTSQLSALLPAPVDNLDCVVVGAAGRAGVGEAGVGVLAGPDGQVGVEVDWLTVPHRAERLTAVRPVAISLLAAQGTVSHLPPLTAAVTEGALALLAQDLLLAAQVRAGVGAGEILAGEGGGDEGGMAASLLPQGPQSDHEADHDEGEDDEQRAQGDDQDHLPPEEQVQLPPDVLLQDEVLLGVAAGGGGEAGAGRVVVVLLARATLGYQGERTATGAGVLCPGPALLLAPPPGLLVPALTPTDLRPQDLLGAAVLRAELAVTAAGEMLQDGDHGALLVAGPHRDPALAQHHLHPPLGHLPGEAGLAGAVTGAGTARHRDVGRSHLLDQRGVGPGQRHHGLHQATAHIGPERLRNVFVPAAGLVLVVTQHHHGGLLGPAVSTGDQQAGAGQQRHQERQGGDHHDHHHRHTSSLSRALDTTNC